MPDRRVVPPRRDGRAVLAHPGVGERVLVRDRSSRWGRDANGRPRAPSGTDRRPSRPADDDGSARGSAGPWGSAATEPCLRSDIYHFKCSIERTGFRDDEEARLKRFRELSAQRVLRLSELGEADMGFANALPGRVLVKNRAEWTPNCQLYTAAEFLRRDDAIDCGVGSILAVPVHEIGRPQHPVCVVEIVRLGARQTAGAAERVKSAMANASIAQDVEFLEAALAPLGLAANVVPQEHFGFSFGALCPPMDPPEDDGADLSLVAATARACPLTADAVRPHERAVMERIVGRAVEAGEVELAQFWYFIDRRRGSLVAGGLPHAANEAAGGDGELAWFAEDDNANTRELGLRPFSRLTAYRIACEECALPLATGGPVAAAYNAYTDTAKSKIIYWPDVQNATASKFVMSHTAASLRVEAVAAVVVPNILVPREGAERRGACAVLELVLPTDKTRDQHRKSISSVVNMAHAEGKQMQVSWSRQQEQSAEGGASA